MGAITTPSHRLHWPVGDAAVGFVRGRPKISDEDGGAMGDERSDEEYHRRFYEYFGIRL